MGRSKKTSVGAILGLGALALGPLAVGVALLAIRYVSMRDMKAAREWVATPCVVGRSEFVSSNSDHGGKMLVFEYRYSVNGTEFKGDRLDTIVGQMGDDDLWEEQIHAMYPVGATATCYVDPIDPSNSVFDRDHGADSPRRMWLLAFPFTFVGLIFSVGLISLFVSEMSNKKKTPEPIGENPVLRSSPPRRIPLLTQCAILAGPPGSQLIWLFLIGFFYVFILLEGPMCYARLFGLFKKDASTEGSVTDVRRLNEREFSVYLYQTTVSYEVDGRSYSHASFTRGDQYTEGDRVTLLYDPVLPEKGTIEGTRASNFSWWHSAIPLGVVLLLLLSICGMYVHDFRVMRLLVNGMTVTAQWCEKDDRPMKTGTPLNEPEFPEKKSNYRFEIGGKTYHAKKYAASKKSAGIRSEKGRLDEVVVLYNPKNPNDNVIFSEELEKAAFQGVSNWDRLIGCAVPLVSIGVIALVYWMAEVF